VLVGSDDAWRLATVVRWNDLPKNGDFL